MVIFNPYHSCSGSGVTNSKLKVSKSCISLPFVKQTKFNTPKDVYILNNLRKIRISDDIRHYKIYL